MPVKIIFLVPYPLGHAPSQRFRFEQYFTTLRREGHSIEVQSFLTSQNWQVFFKTGHAAAKLWALASGVIRRCAVLLRIPFCDFVFIHREAAPLGPPVFEWIIAKVLRKRIVYDFDDAIWTTDRTDESAIVSWLKWRSKVRRICRWSYKVSCGNEYLCSFARQHNKNVVLNPTTIDMNAVEGFAREDDGVVTIGWTGTHSTMKYLQEVTPVLSALRDRHREVLRIKIIADMPPEFFGPDAFVAWKKESEIEDLSDFDIGIMPLPDDEWTRGKCGFKALQYLALGIPAVCSPVGVNSNIIKNGENGFLCSSAEEWAAALQKLFANPDLRRKLGERGRTVVAERYSTAANERNFLALFA